VSVIDEFLSDEEAKEVDELVDNDAEVVYSEHSEASSSKSLD